MLQWTVYIYVFAIIDGQPLYGNADDRDMCNVYQQETYCIELRQRMEEKDMKDRGSTEEDCGVLTHETDDLKQEPNAVRVRWVKDYIFVNSAVHWNMAKERCENMGGYLLEIDSKRKFWWTGGRDYHGDDTWAWDSSKDSFLYDNWGGNQPDIGFEGCLVLTSAGDWHDYPCDSTFFFICEKNSTFS
ncbi:C-type lectin 37Db-like isoform X2 [Crassostrea virginica]